MINFVFRLDSSSIIGYGHLMRCMTLANKFIFLGFNVTFILGYNSKDSLDFINNEHVNTIILPDVKDEKDDANKCLEYIDHDSFYMIVDHYFLSYKWESEIIKSSKKMIVIDDLANRKHQCNILIDSSYKRNYFDYEKLVPEYCQFFLGERYCLLRPEFQFLRDAAQIRRANTTAITRLLVSFGATDSEKYTLRVLNYLNEMPFSGEVDVLISTGCIWLDELKSKTATMNNVTLHMNANNVAELILNADLAIGALGTSTWERASLGLPCICIVTADNQIFNAKNLNSIKAIFLSDIDQLAHDLSSLLFEQHSLQDWQGVSDTSFKLVDGKGINRVTHAILKDEYKLIDFNLSDTDDLYAWQSQPDARLYSRDINIPIYNEHVSWVATSLDDPLRRMWIVKVNDISAGYIRLDTFDETEEVSILIANKFRGLGLAKFAVMSAISNRKGSSVLAHVKPENQASINLFQACGFKRVDRDHFIWSQ